MSSDTKRRAAVTSRPTRFFPAALAVLAFLAPPVARAQQPEPGPSAFDSVIAAADWDDDWWYPEGPIKIAGVRYSLFVGPIVTAFSSSSSRDLFGSRLIDPNITLYRPAHKGTSFDADMVWIGLTKRGQTGRYFAPTFGVRRTFVESARQQRIVPFGALRVGPYFTRTGEADSTIVLGGNATLGVELDRRFSLAVRYDLIRRVDGVDLSTVAFDIAVALPVGQPRGARAKMHDFVPPPGRMIDVGGHRLHLVCLGEGTPTVILEAGMSDAWITWSRVQPELARTTRVCAYDRAGIGYSEPGPLPRTSEQIAGELHLLLQRAGVPGPYVLVGHSFGGLNVRLFAARHPGEVAGLVLVDASHEDQLSRSPAEVQRGMDAIAAQLRRRAEDAAAGKRVGVVVPNLPVAVASRPAWYRTLYQELEALPESSRHVKALDHRLDVPLVVVTAGRIAPMRVSREARAEWQRVWVELQEDLVRRSPHGEHVVAASSGHYVQREAPQVVIDAVRQVVDRVRAGRNVRLAEAR